MARTENLALVTESINCIGVCFLSSVVPFVMGFECDGTKKALTSEVVQEAVPTHVLRLTPPRSE